jgi:hypothetical protein
LRDRLFWGFRSRRFAGLLRIDLRHHCRLGSWICTTRQQQQWDQNSHEDSDVTFIHDVSFFRIHFINDTIGCTNVSYPNPVQRPGPDRQLL